MRCKRCGKDIGTTRKCPFCGTEQHYIDPFTTLGDIEPNKGYENMDDRGDDLTIPSTKMDCFSALGDLDQSGGCFGELHYAKTDAVINSIDPFHAMGNLDGSDILLNHSGMDAPTKGGFKPMDELIPSNGVLDTPEQTDLPTKPVVPKTRIAFAWKKWMTIAACCTTTICLLLWVVCSGSLKFSNDKSSVEVAENVLEQVLETPILEVDAEEIDTPAFLYTIESRNGYEILSFEKTQTGAVATMRVFAPDVYGVANNLDSSNTFNDANALMNALDNAIKTAPIVEKQVVIEYILTNQGYAPILTAEFLDAYYGGIYQLRDEAIANAATEG